MHFVAQESFCSRFWYGVIELRVDRGFRRGWDYQRRLGGFIPEFEDFLSTLVLNRKFKTSGDSTFTIMSWAGGETILWIEIHMMGPPDVIEIVIDRLKAFGNKLCLEIDQGRKFNVERLYRFMY